MLPGVQGGTEGLTGMYVRGGGPDQNLILLDGVPLYNVSHMLGIFSVFNPGAIESAELIKGGFPARYGGRLSSVLDITTKQGNMQKWEGEGSVGIMSARMSANGPLQKGKTSLSVSGRRSYYDLMIKPFISAYTAAQDYEDITVGYFFNDINVRLDHKLNDKQTLTFNGFLVRDKFYIDYKREWDGFNDYNQSYNKGVDDYNAGVSWGTALAQTVLKTKVNDHLVNTTSVYYNRYRFLTKYSLEDYYYVRDSLGQEYESASSINLAYRTYINDIAAKTEFQKKISHSANLRYGGIMNFQMFQPAASIYELNEVLREDEIDTLFKGNTRYSQQIQSYIEFEKEFGYRFKVNLGAHLNVFRQNDYLSGSLQPRVMGLMHLNDWSSLKVSYAMMQQNLHLLTNPSIGLPTDLWVPATKNAPSEISHQLAFGYAATLPKNMSLTLEGYYKTMSNVIEYAEAELFLGIGDDWEETIAIGNGNAYGIEFLLQKSKGKFTGWIGYTLSFTNRQFDDLNNGEQFPYRYDRRHDIGITLHYQKSEKFDIGLNWVYGTGYAFSLSHGSSFSPNYLNWGYNQNYETIEFTARNNYRVPSYHRLDLGFNWHKKKKWGKRTWQLGFYNTYNRMNPFAVFWNFEFGYDSNITPDNNKLKVLTLLPIIPSFTYQFKF